MTKLVLAVTGASAQPIAERSIELLLSNGIDLHLILSRGAYEVWNSENNIQVPLDPIRQSLFWSERLPDSGAPVAGALGRRS